MTDQYSELYRQVASDNGLKWDGPREVLDAYLDTKGVSPGKMNPDDMHRYNVIHEGYDAVVTEAHRALIQDLRADGVPEDWLPEEGKYHQNFWNYMHDRTDNDVLLMAAAEIGDVESIHDLLPYSTVDHHDSVALHVALKNNRHEAAEALLPFSNPHTVGWEFARVSTDHMNHRRLTDDQWQVLDSLETKMRLQAHVPQAREYLDPPSLAKQSTEGQGTLAPERKRSLRL